LTSQQHEFFSSIAHRYRAIRTRPGNCSSAIMTRPGNGSLNICLVSGTGLQDIFFYFQTIDELFRACY